MTEPTRKILRSALPSRWLAAVVMAAVSLAETSAAAQSRGGLVVLGLRAPDGDDDAAANATTALRRAARSAGFEVPNDSPALEQSMAAFGCDDSLPADCLAQIAADLHAERMIYGAVRRHGHGREAPMAIQVGLFETASRATTGHEETEIARAIAQDNDAVTPTARRMINAMLPPPALTASASPTLNGTHTAARPLEGIREDHAGPATPIRRYLGVVGIAVGLAALLAAGIVDLDYQLIYPNNAQWNNYRPGISGADVCAFARGPMASTYTPPSDAFSNAQAAAFCDGGDALGTAGWALLATGGVFFVAGLVLVLTDHTGETHAGAARAHERVQWLAAPVLSPSYQGAAFGLRF